MAVIENGVSNNQIESNGVDHSDSEIVVSRSNDNTLVNGNGVGNDKDEGFKKEMSDLDDMFSKLNPLAKEFVPNSNSYYRAVPLPLQLPQPPSAAHFGYVAPVVNEFVIQPNHAPFANVNGGGNFGNGRVWNVFVCFLRFIFVFLFLIVFIVCD